MHIKLRSEELNEVTWWTERESESERITLHCIFEDHVCRCVNRTGSNDGLL